MAGTAALNSDAAEALAGRVLLQVSQRRAARYSGWVDDACSGLLLTGEGALARAGQLREQGFAGTVVVDEARYRVTAASAAAPFPALDEGQLSLFGDPLEFAMLAQLAFADVALTPTGYLAPGDVAALEAAASRTARLGDPRVVFAAPVDGAWLYPGAVERLAEVLRAVPGPAAVLVGGRPDPEAAAAGLCRLLKLAPGTGVLRSGLDAFGAVGCGAGFSGFGMDGSMRRLVPPTASGTAPGGGPDSPAVLFPELMEFLLGMTLANRFAGRAPVCGCACCQGEPLDRFVSMAHQVSAAGHNAAVVTGWVRGLMAVGGSESGPWWRELCRHALGKYALWNDLIRQKRGFVAPGELAAWALREPSDQVVAASAR